MCPEPSMLTYSSFLFPRNRTDTLSREKRAVFLLMESWQNGKTDKAFPREPITQRLSKDGLCFNGNATPKIGKALPRHPVNRPSGLPPPRHPVNRLSGLPTRASRCETPPPLPTFGHSPNRLQSQKNIFVKPKAEIVRFCKKAREKRRFDPENAMWHGLC